MPEVFIPRLIELYRQGRMPFDRIMRTYAFADIEQACKDTTAGVTIKPILMFE